MTDPRPLKNIFTETLKTMHRAVERQPGLIVQELENSAGELCSLGAMIRSYLDRSTLKANDKVMIPVFIFLGLIPSDYNTDMNAEKLDAFTISFLNDGFKGTPEQRREFMLRHIVEELRHRGESVAKVEAREVVEANA